MELAAQHPEWVVGFQDEVWWSRVTQPSLYAWTEQDEALRLVAQTVAANDPEPKALACYGLLVSCPAARQTWSEQMWLRFVAGRPLSALTTHYLGWCCAKLERLGKSVLILIWDNASWHVSKAVRTWIRTHNRMVKQQGHGVRIVAFCPPRVPGSTGLSRIGFMASATSSNRPVCLLPRNWLTASAPTLDVTMSLTLLSPKMFPDSALGTLTTSGWEGAMQKVNDWLQSRRRTDASASAKVGKGLAYQAAC